MNPGLRESSGRRVSTSLSLRTENPLGNLSSKENDGTSNNRPAHNFRKRRHRGTSKGFREQGGAGTVGDKKSKKSQDGNLYPDLRPSRRKGHSSTQSTVITRTSPDNRPVQKSSSEHALDSGDNPVVSLSEFHGIGL